MKSNLSKIFDFLHQIEKLKSALRYNTTTSGRKESSAEHSWRLSLMAFLVAEELTLKIDHLKAIKMALIHDLAEAVVGDFDSYEVARGKVSKEDKEKAEKEGMKKLQRLLPKERGNEVYSLWEEYEQQETAEAKYIKALDKLETLTQFAETGYGIFHEGTDFIAGYADIHVKKVPELREVLAVVKKELKKQYKKGKIPWKAGYDSF